jgi:hypothetical protein
MIELLSLLSPHKLLKILAHSRKMLNAAKIRPKYKKIENLTYSLSWNLESGYDGNGMVKKTISRYCSFKQRVQYGNGF